MKGHVRRSSQLEHVSLSPCMRACTFARPHKKGGMLERHHLLQDPQLQLHSMCSCNGCQEPQSKVPDGAAQGVMTSGMGSKCLQIWAATSWCTTRLSIAAQQLGAAYVFWPRCKRRGSANHTLEDTSMHRSGTTMYRKQDIALDQHKDAFFWLGSPYQLKPNCACRQYKAGLSCLDQ